MADKDTAYFKERDSKMDQIAPLCRRGKPEELSGLLVYLSSDVSSFVTGQVFVIDGGWTAH